MSTSLVPVDPSSQKSSFAITQAQAILRQMVLDSVQSIHSKRNYAKALDDLFAFCASRPLSRALLMEYRTTMDHLSPSTINVRLSAIRKLVGEARRNGMIGLEEAASRIQFSRTVGALNAIIRLSSDIDSYRAVSPSRMSEDKTRDKTREPEFYFGSYNVADNDAAKSMLCNKTADVFLL
jgi:hypothetical protein